MAANVASLSPSFVPSVATSPSAMLSSEFQFQLQFEECNNWLQKLEEECQAMDPQWNVSDFLQSIQSSLHSTTTAATATATATATIANTTTANTTTGTTGSTISNTIATMDSNDINDINDTIDTNNINDTTDASNNLNASCDKVQQNFCRMIPNTWDCSFDDSISFEHDNIFAADTLTNNTSRTNNQTQGYPTTFTMTKTNVTQAYAECLLQYNFPDCSCSDDQPIIDDTNEASLLKGDLVKFGVAVAIVFLIFMFDFICEMRRSLLPCCFTWDPFPKQEYSNSQSKKRKNQNDSSTKSTTLDTINPRDRTTSMRSGDESDVTVSSSTLNFQKRVTEIRKHRQEIENRYNALKLDIGSRHSATKGSSSDHSNGLSYNDNDDDDDDDNVNHDSFAVFEEDLESAPMKISKDPYGETNKRQLKT